MATRRKNSPDVLLATTPNFRLLTGCDSKGVQRIYVETNSEPVNDLISFRVFDGELNEEFLWTLGHAMRKFLTAEHPLSEITRMAMRGFSVLYPEAKDWPTEPDPAFPAELVPFAAFLTIDYAPRTVFAAHLHAMGIFALSDQAGDVPGLNDPADSHAVKAGPGMHMRMLSPDGEDTEWDEPDSREDGEHADGWYPLLGKWEEFYCREHDTDGAAWLVRHPAWGTIDLNMLQFPTIHELAALVDKLTWEHPGRAYMMIQQALRLRAYLAESVPVDVYQACKARWSLSTDGESITYASEAMPVAFPVSFWLALAVAIPRARDKEGQSMFRAHRAIAPCADALYYIVQHDQLVRYGQ